MRRSARTASGGEFGSEGYRDDKSVVCLVLTTQS